MAYKLQHSSSLPYRVSVAGVSRMRRDGEVVRGQEGGIERVNNDGPATPNGLPLPTTWVTV
ncbi:hypothetical protein NEUTE1DRAFT_117656 [Neurospora tetrasperma FGSC 2508]|uniref:Uncharacterized protein n=1 Tax=Neurospora tetrasperma (strain FGSC 2508 / ATCC MYA-4615 / P0657) TaxID=510951 RepID=F8MSK0_NEUT8|nr:uncharacterized protein NEUTE1DRAFT_117656 [Neurospora tetrasperma FGSC 2508]EGO55087.1 hypothetical protein NEUTE1DRAFT_117656 [Neurospora tetrasperma FGSC 2508]EGZ69705.1 hypothetical protein NEUTE2DRAFT_145635 [Neurospora tetrasperma FGSC 2509]